MTRAFGVGSELPFEALERLDSELSAVVLDHAYPRDLRLTLAEVDPVRVTRPEPTLCSGCEHGVHPGQGYVTKIAIGHAAMMPPLTATTCLGANQSCSYG